MSTCKQLDLSLYLVVDPALCGARGMGATVKAAIKGGVSMIQLRSQRRNLRQLLEDAESLREIAHHHDVPFIVNDHLDIALAAKADGIHVGQEDMPASIARHLLGRDKIVGISITDGTQLASADAAIVNYVGLGPVFATATKPDAAPALGLDGFHALRPRIDLPVVAIGGLNSGNARAVMKAGADGVAVVSAICAALNPEQAAHDLLQIVREARA